MANTALKEFAGLKNLRFLDLGGTRVTDAALKELTGLKSLRSLDLGGTRVTDAGLKELASLDSLELLTLRKTPITDVGIKELAGLKKLQFLFLEDTKVTDAGPVELRKALPKCNIMVTAGAWAGEDDAKAEKAIKALGGSISCEPIAVSLDRLNRDAKQIRGLVGPI